MAFFVKFCVIFQLVAAVPSLADNGILRRFVHGCQQTIPCPPLPCSNPIYGPGNCCGICPVPPTPVTPTPEIEVTLGGPIDAHGPNCRYQGHVIPEGQTVTLPSGESVFCQYGGTYSAGTFSVVQPIVG